MPASPAFFIKTTLLVVATASCASTQGRPDLRIDSPPSGTAVHPGQTITVVVSSPSGAVANVVVILGEDGIQGGPAGSLPARILVSIPEKLEAARRYSMTAIALFPKGEQVFASIELDVELPDSPPSGAPGARGASVEKITAEPQELILESQGQQSPIKISAHYFGGEQVDITESSKLTYMSSDRAVAIVDAYGMVRAVAPGQGSIIAIYLQAGASLRTSVPITVEGIVTAVPSSLNFGGNRGVPVGTAVSQEVTFTYETANATIKINKVEITGEFSQKNNCLSSSTVRTEKQCTVTVTFSPKATGKREGELTVYDTLRAAPTKIPLAGLAADR